MSLIVPCSAVDASMATETVASTAVSMCSKAAQLARGPSSLKTVSLRVAAESGFERDLPTRI